MVIKIAKKTLRKNTLDWIEGHPQLVERLEHLQEIAEDSRTDLETLEKAERAVMDEIERLGGLALEGWLCSRQTKVSEEMSGKKGVRKHSKKNSSSPPCWGGWR